MCVWMQGQVRPSQRSERAFSCTRFFISSIFCSIAARCSAESFEDAEGRHDLTPPATATPVDAWLHASSAQLTSTHVTRQSSAAPRPFTTTSLSPSPHKYAGRTHRAPRQAPRRSMKGDREHIGPRRPTSPSQVCNFTTHLPLKSGKRKELNI